MDVGVQKRCRKCGEMFAIHRRCDRGREYCGKACRHSSREEIKREARARHQKSRSGRADHRYRMRNWRAQKRARVMDLRSKNLAPDPRWCRGQTGRAHGGRGPEPGRQGHEWIESQSHWHPSRLALSCWPRAGRTSFFGAC